MQMPKVSECQGITIDEEVVVHFPLDWKTVLYFFSTMFIFLSEFFPLFYSESFTDPGNTELALQV